MAIQHELLANTAGKSHGIIARTVADAAALAAEVISADDVAQARVIKQTDTGQLWIPLTTGAGATFSLVTAYSTGVRESSGPTNLNVGAIGNQSLMARVGTAIISAVLGAGLSFGSGTLSLTEVSNTSQGVLPAITAASAVPVSNGGGTGVTWVALSGGGSPVGTSRTISTTAPLAGGGDLSANRTLTVATVDNTTSGVLPITGGVAGQVPISSATTVSWGTNFQAQNLTTSGVYIASSTTNAMNVGATPATTGGYRWSHGVNIVGRNNANSANRTIIDWGVTATDNLHIGDGSTTMVVNASTSGIGYSIRLGGTTRLSLSTGTLNLVVGQLAFDNSIVSPIIQPSTNTTNGATATTLNISGPNATGTTSTGGGLDLYAGTGTSANGITRIRAAGAGTVRLTVNETGLGLYATTPVAQAARVGQATNSTGTAGTNRTMSNVDTAGVADVAKINQNFANIVDNMWNPLETAIHNLGVTA